MGPPVLFWELGWLQEPCTVPILAFNQYLI